MKAPARLINIDELSARLSISVKTLRNKLSSNPTSLPPRTYVPNVHTVLFDERDVEKWINSLKKGYARLPFGEESKIFRRRGRPTKAEQIARRNSAQHTE